MPKTMLSSEQTLSATTPTLSAESSLFTSKSASSAVATSSASASQSGSSTLPLFAWLSQASSTSLTSTATSTAESSSNGSTSNSLESSTSLDSFSQIQSLSSSFPTSDTSTALSSESRPLLTMSSTTSQASSTSAKSDNIAPLAWTSLGSDSSLQVVGSLEMFYPFTTHIPLLVASPTQTSYDIHSPSFERTVPASATSSSSLASTFRSFSSESNQPSRIISLTSLLGSPLTLHSGDFIEMFVGHSPAPTTTHDSSASPLPETHGWASLPVDIERLELSTSMDMSQAILKRSFHSDASSLTAELLSEAAESARSLLSVMRNIATHSEYDQPVRHATSTHVRDRQFIYPEEDSAAPTQYKGSPTPEYRNVYYPPSTLITTTTVTPDCTTAITTTTLDYTTTTTLLSTTTTLLTTSLSPNTTTTTTTTTTTESNSSSITGFPSIPINVVVTLVQPTV
ncbi:hypothetical protein BX667DRAFT_497422 [Coemansia mojavensis]|nr:hypothetical protein BX667DRAFT_497422 [Coemansia mojavensis]